MTVTIHNADATKGLPFVAAETVQTCFTSPPYWGLRDYGLPPSVIGGDADCSHEWGDEGRLHKGGPHGSGVMLRGSRAVVDAQAAVKSIRTGAFCDRCGAWLGQLGLEPTPELYVEHIVGVMRDVWRTLKNDGTLWLNLGDCYATGAGRSGETPGGGDQGAKWAGSTSPRDHRGVRLPNQSDQGKHFTRKGSNRAQRGDGNEGTAYGPMVQPNRLPIPGLKPKDLVGIPWRVAFALQADGWYLRSDVIWHKPNPMPESVTDRPTKAHEYLFLLTKSERYYYDAAAVAQPCAELLRPQTEARRAARMNRPVASIEGGQSSKEAAGEPTHTMRSGEMVNRRTVWTIATRPFREAHFATCPPDLIEPCIRAGSRPGDVVLDPFGGAGTTGLVADRLGRDAVLVEMNPDYAAIARGRINDDAPLFHLQTAP